MERVLDDDFLDEDDVARIRKDGGGLVEVIFIDHHGWAEFEDLGSRTFEQIVSNTLLIPEDDGVQLFTVELGGDVQDEAKLRDIVVTNKTYPDAAALMFLYADRSVVMGTS